SPRRRRRWATFDYFDRVFIRTRLPCAPSQATGSECTLGSGRLAWRSTLRTNVTFDASTAISVTRPCAGEGGQTSLWRISLGSRSKPSRSANRFHFHLPLSPYCTNDLASCWQSQADSTCPWYT